MFEITFKLPIFEIKYNKGCKKGKINTGLIWDEALNEYTVVIQSKEILIIEVSLSILGIGREGSNYIKKELQAFELGKKCLIDKIFDNNSDIKFNPTVSNYDLFSYFGNKILDYKRQNKNIYIILKDINGKKYKFKTKFKFKEIDEKLEIAFNRMEI